MNPQTGNSAIVQPLLVALGVLFCAAASVLAIACLAGYRVRAQRWICALLGAGAFPVLGVLAARGIAAGRVPVFGRFETLAFFSLALIGAYSWMALRHGTRGISALLAPFATLTLALAAAGVNERVVVSHDVGRGWLALHAGTAFVGYALCTLAAALGAGYLIQDANLKHKRFGPTFDGLPDLATLDNLMSRQIGAAFLMLTASMAVGVHLVRLSGGGAAWLTDPKIMATLATWATYAVLMHMRTSDRHGKQMALITIVGLGFVLFSFLGIHVFTDSLHSFVLTGYTR